MASPTVVLIHGAWHGSWCWHNVEQHLGAAGINSVAVNLPGHNTPGSSKRIWNSMRSYVDHVHGVLDALDGDVVLVGHSMGGLIVQRVLETHPTAAAMLVASVPPLGVGGALVRLAGSHPDQVAETLALSLWPVVSDDDRVREQFFSPDTPEDVVAAAGAKLQNESYVAFLSMLFRHARPDAVKQNGTPISVIAARFDTIFTLEEQTALAGAYNVELDVIDCAHDIMLEPQWPELATRIEQVAHQL